MVGMRRRQQLFLVEEETAYSVVLKSVLYGLKLCTD
jgi:hypothetical protein